MVHLTQLSWPMVTTKPVAAQSHSYQLLQSHLHPFNNAFVNLRLQTTLVSCTKPPAAISTFSSTTQRLGSTLHTLSQASAATSIIPVFIDSGNLPWRQPPPHLKSDASSDVNQFSLQDYTQTESCHKLTMKASWPLRHYGNILHYSHDQEKTN